MGEKKNTTVYRSVTSILTDSPSRDEDEASSCHGSSGEAWQTVKEQRHQLSNQTEAVQSTCPLNPALQILKLDSNNKDRKEDSGLRNVLFSNTSLCFMDQTQN